MLSEFWSKIKSGSDIRGVAVSGENNNEVHLTNEVVEKISFAFALWLSQKTGLDCSSLTIAVGHDSRISAMRIKNACINAFRSVGINVYDCSLASTPAMFMALSVLSCTASVQITASHHPYDRNGFKFFAFGRGLSGADIEEILELAQIEQAPSAAKKGVVRSIKLMSYYSEKLKNMIKERINSQSDYDMPLKNIKISVDAGNGAGGFFATDVLAPLGADVSGSAFVEPDGNFPNHIPNPEDNAALKSISELTVKSGSDLGIIFDTDVDRVAVVNKQGAPIAKSKLIALASVIALEDEPNSIIVTDSVTSDSLKKFIEKKGGVQFRYKRGYNNVINMAKKINANGGMCTLAIESSGHAAFKENDFVDDGAYLAAKIIIKYVKMQESGISLNECTDGLVEAKEQVSFRLPILGENIEETAEKILSDLKNYIISNRQTELEKDNVEGIRINFSAKHQRGWALLRKSLHDPVMVLYAESDVRGGLKIMLNILKPFFKKHPQADISEIEIFLKS